MSGFEALQIGRVLSSLVPPRCTSAPNKALANSEIMGETASAQQTAELRELRRAALSGDNGAWLKLGEPSVASFHHVVQRVACPYARSSVLLGAPVWDPELSPDTNILHCAYNLRRVAELNKSIDALDGVPDGMVMEVPIRQVVVAKRTGEKVSGQGGREHELGLESATFRRPGRGDCQGRRD